VTRHERHPSPFPFDLPENSAVFVCARVAAGAPILEVSHDEEGDWQFLCGADHSDPAPDDGGLLRCLGCVLAGDASLAALATLRCAESASRPDVATPWRITDEHEAFLERAIAEHGWGITAIPEDDEGPAFAYTAGLARLDRPELIVVGLPPSSAMRLLNAVGELVRDGRAPLGSPLAGCLPDPTVTVRLRAVRDDEPIASFITYARALAHGRAVSLVEILPLRFVVDDLSGAPTRALIARHLAGMHANSPPESVHAFDVDQLRQPDVTFWSAWVGDALAGCGALKRLDAERGELKSMRVADAFLGRGVGRALLEHLVAEARARGLRSLWLETGSTPAFIPALRLYESAGFSRCGPFGDYGDDPFSVFMTRAI